MIDKNNTIACSAEFFEAKYQQDVDPWSFASDAYELHRYRSILNALCHRRYHFAFEPGCSIGVLTEHLADICDTIQAIDFSLTAVVRAQARCAHRKNVTVRCASLSESSFEDDFDLLVLSEIGYYFNWEDWRSISSMLVEKMPPGGTVLMAHWLGHSEDHRLSGDEVHNILLSHPQLHLELSERNRGFRLDRLVRS